MQNCYFQLLKTLHTKRFCLVPIFNDNFIRFTHSQHKIEEQIRDLDKWTCKRFFHQRENYVHRRKLRMLGGNLANAEVGLDSILLHICRSLRHIASFSTNSV